jgi:hypothetical protein
MSKRGIFEKPFAQLGWPAKRGVAFDRKNFNQILRRLRACLNFSGEAKAGNFWVRQGKICSCSRGACNENFNAV